MATQLDNNDRRFLVQLLRDLPDLRMPKGRQALIENAVSGYPKSHLLLGNIQWDDSPMVFASEVIRWFESFEVADGVGALSLLADSIEPLVSAEQRPLLQALKQRYGWDAGPHGPSPETSSSSVRSILLLAADPGDLARLRLATEFREIQERLRLAVYRDRFTLHQRMALRPADLSQALLDLQPAIVHFSGHGSGAEGLYLEDDWGQGKLVTGEALAALFRTFADRTKAVILNACFTEPQAEAIAEHIDFVIGTRQKIGDDTATAFSLGFYQALGAGRSIEDAFTLGCTQIQLQGLGEHLVPVLLRKPGKVSPDA